MNKHEGSDFEFRQICLHCGSENVSDGIVIDTWPQIHIYRCFDCKKESRVSEDFTE